MVAVPDVVDRDVFAAASRSCTTPGFKVDGHRQDSPRPGGTILDQRPGHRARSSKRARRSNVTCRAPKPTVPDVTTIDIGAAKVRLAKRRARQPHRSPPTTATTSIPARSCAPTRRRTCARARSTPLELVVAADPHVKVPNVVGAGPGAAPRARSRPSGLDVTVQTASSSTAGRHGAQEQSPGDATAVRGDTVTLTVSSGPKQVNVPVRRRVGPRRRHQRARGPQASR